MLKCLEILKPSILGVQNRRRSSWYIYRIYVTYTAYKLYTGYRLVKPLITRYKIHPRPRYNKKQFLGFRNIFEKRRTYHLISSHILQIKRVYLLIFILSPNKLNNGWPLKNDGWFRLLSLWNGSFSGDIRSFSGDVYLPVFSRMFPAKSWSWLPILFWEGICSRWPPTIVINGAIWGPHKL